MTNDNRKVANWLVSLESWHEFFDQLCLYWTSSGVVSPFDVIDYNVAIVELLNRGFDAQEGLNKFLFAAIYGCRYSRDFMDAETGFTIIPAFLERGAKMNYDTLFQSRLLECDEFEYVPMCARIIDTTYQYGLDASKYGDWKSITPMYWGDAGEDIPPEMVEKMYLKECSKYLQSL